MLSEKVSLDRKQLENSTVESDAQPITSSQKTHREYQNQSPGAMKTMSLKEVSMAISYIESINSDTGVATCFLIGFEAGSIDRSSCLVL